MGVSKNKGTPKWMVKIMENPIKMDDLGVKPTIFGNVRLLKTWLPLILAPQNEGGRPVEIAPPLKAAAKPTGKPPRWGVFFWEKLDVFHHELGS